LQAGLDINLIIQKLAIGPREILNIEVPVITEGQPANLVVFNPVTEWEYSSKNNRSKSGNSPFMGQQLKGKILLTANNNYLYK